MNQLLHDFITKGVHDEAFTRLQNVPKEIQPPSTDLYSFTMSVATCLATPPHIPEAETFLALNLPWVIRNSGVTPTSSNESIYTAILAMSARLFHEFSERSCEVSITTDGTVSGILLDNNFFYDSTFSVTLGSTHSIALVSLPHIEHREKIFLGERFMGPFHPSVIPYNLTPTTVLITDPCEVTFTSDHKHFHLSSQHHSALIPISVKADTSEIEYFQGFPPRVHVEDAAVADVPSGVVLPLTFETVDKNALTAYVGDTLVRRSDTSKPFVCTSPAINDPFHVVITCPHCNLTLHYSQPGFTVSFGAQYLRSDHEYEFSKGTTLQLDLKFDSPLDGTIYVGTQSQSGTNMLLSSFVFALNEDTDLQIYYERSYV